MSIVERVPPHDVDSEQAVLAAGLVDLHALVVARGILEPGDFYRPAHAILWRALCAVADAGKPVELLTVRDALGANLDDVGGFPYLVDLYGSIPTTAHTEYHARHVADLALRRAAIAACADSLGELFDPHAEEPVTAAQGRLMAVQARRNEKAVRVGDVAADVTDDTNRQHQARKRYERTGPAVTTGIKQLDEMLYVAPGNYVVMAARPSAGKTALANQMMLHVAQNHGPVYFASLEMDKEAITRRLLAQMTGVGTVRQRNGAVSDAELDLLSQAARSIAELPLWIDDRPAMTVAQIAAGAQQQHAKTPLALVVIDHLSEVAAVDPRASAYERMSQIARDVGVMFRRLRVPGIAIAQLSREVDRDNRKPRASDLRDSGQLEQKADAIVMLHRPHREGEKTDAELLLVKQRDGAVGTVPVVYEAERTRFVASVSAGALA